MFRKLFKILKILAKVWIKICSLFVIAAIITIATGTQESTKMESIFSVPVLLTMFGFGLTMYAFLHNSVISIRKDILLTKQDKMLSVLEKVFTEISHDLIYIFTSLILIVVIEILSSIDIISNSSPQIYVWNSTFSVMRILLLQFRNFFVISVLYSIKDILFSVFNINRISNLIARKNAEKERSD